jgi:acid phosphatase family membrane protein YuiD
MTALTEVFVTVKPDVDKFGPEVRKKLAKIDAKKEGSQVATRFGVGMNGAMGGIVSKSAGIFAAGFAAIQGAKVFGGFIKDAAESAKISRITANAIRATGGAAKISADQVSALATSISNKTAIDDEQIQAAANMLLTFKNIRNEAGKNNDIFNRATQAAADLSVQFGGMDGASKQLGKALNDPIKGTTALAKAGVTFTEQQKKQIKTLVESGNVLGAQKIILKEIEGQVGGAAAAASDPMERLKVVAGNLGESIGGLLLPTVNKFATFVTDTVVPGIHAMGAAFQEGDVTSDGFVGFMERIGVVARDVFDYFKANILPVLKDFGGFVLSTVLPALGTFATSLATNVAPVVKELFTLFKTNVLPVLKELATFVVTKVLPAVSSFANYLMTTLLPVVKDLVKNGMEGAKAAIDRVKTAFQENEPQIRKFIGVVGEVVKWIAEKLGPILGWLAGKQMKWVGDQIAGVITFIGKMVDAVTWLVGAVQTAGTSIATAWRSIKTGADTMWTGIKTAFANGVQAAWTKMSGFFQDIIDGAAKIFGWVPGVGEKLKNAAKEFGTFRDSVNTKLAGITDQTINVALKYSSKGVNLSAPSSVGRMEAGGGVFGGVRGKDSVPALLMPDEHVWTTKEVAAAGGHGAMKRMRQAALAGELNGYAAGGPVGFNVRTSSPSPALLAKEVAAHALKAAGPYIAAGAKQIAAAAPGGPPGARRSFRGVTLNQRTIGMLLNAERILGAVFHITQGSYSTRVAASGSTHAGGGAMDTNGPRGWNTAVRALRSAGFAAWHRTPSQGPWGHHIHSIALGDSSASQAAKNQMAAYRRGGDGLGHGMAKGGAVTKQMARDLGIDTFDTGGRWRSGTLAANTSGKTETVLPGGASHGVNVTVNLPAVVGMTKQDLRNYLVKEIDGLRRQGRI